MSWRDYQAMQKIVEIGDRFISYVDQGAGEPVVLLHGIPAWGYLWHRQVGPLARTHRVLVPDLPGYGYSDKSDAFDRSLAAQAGFIARWLDALDIASATFVGNGIGGGIALRIAVLMPLRVARLCLVNSVCYDNFPGEDIVEISAPGVYRRVGAADMIQVMEGILKREVASHDLHVLDALLAPYATEVGKLSLIRNASALNTNHTMELAPLLPRLRVPTLVIWGRDDRALPASYGRRLARDIPEAQYQCAPHAGHFVMLDKPGEVLGYIAAFLNTPPAVPA
jgi:pimeloyl-ACP methyl ester carboxylesterase